MYVMHNPVRWVDPFGLFLSSPQAAFFPSTGLWSDGRNRDAGGGAGGGSSSSGLTVLVHGTWSSPSTWTSDFQDWIVGPNGPFSGDSLLVFDWSMDGERGWIEFNTVGGRISGAYMLFNQIMNWRNRSRANYNAPIRLVGHSHGGNVAISAANMLGAIGVGIDALITIATPVRGDFQLNERALVCRHINVYNAFDPIQIAGGGHTILAGRTFSEATNIRVPTPWSSILRLHTPAVGPLWSAYNNHSFMHSNVSIWERHVVSHLRR